ncbi:G-protein beta WD-40 repeats containing protein [Reticulomyxa filosa]|uniref:G-protein beta WD-40 repeats containing protein n=1 Tax=Reticulomyxa filosa TaxID=46433 RepID=X6P9R0_RETFI|nr:G-protein beta WD-40 repeats containing protein [Reticulomyxa filosa]|eukprot:ETO34809.1 G-protein beta WD-40 repeats containing protein [Reticulomyxa filosa]
MCFELNCSQEVTFVLNFWTRSSCIQKGWIIDFNKIIMQYAKYFKQLPLFHNHRGNIFTVRFTKDKKQIIAFVESNLIGVFDDKLRKIKSVQESHWYESERFADYEEKNDRFKLWHDIEYEEGALIEGHGKTKIWDTKTKRAIISIDDIYYSQLSPDDKFVCACSNNNIQIWDLSSRQQVQELKGHSKGISALQCFPNGQMIVSCSYDKTMRIWDVKTGQELQRLQLQSNWISGIDISSDCQTIVFFVLLFLNIINNNLQKKLFLLNIHGKRIKLNSFVTLFLYNAKMPTIDYYQQYILKNFVLNNLQNVQSVTAWSSFLALAPPNSSSCVGSSC